MAGQDELSETVEGFQNLLVARATGQEIDGHEYSQLRGFLMQHPDIGPLLPRFVRTCRDKSQFWQFIKYKYPSYAERRDFIWQEFRPIFDYLEGKKTAPSDKAISATLEKFDSSGVHAAWSKALERKYDDPEGAITAARTLLETVCKHVLDELSIQYPDDADLPKLYRLVAEQLQLAPSQHTETIFKQILGGCTAVVEGLGALRNRLSDAHGKGKVAVKPVERHAELAVNLAGALALYIVNTFEARKEAKA